MEGVCWMIGRWWLMGGGKGERGEVEGMKWKWGLGGVKGLG
jgi:hypothetical protein